MSYSALPPFTATGNKDFDLEIAKLREVLNRVLPPIAEQTGKVLTSNAEGELTWDDAVSASSGQTYIISAEINTLVIADTEIVDLGTDRFVAHSFYSVCTETTGYISGPVGSIGTDSPGYGNIRSNQAWTAATQHVFLNGATTQIAAVTGKVYVQISTAGVGTTQKLRLLIAGWRYT